MMEQITLQKPAEKKQCHCEELEEDLIEWGEQGSVKRPVEDLVISREHRLLRRWYQEWHSGPRRTCFCEFLKERRRLRRRGKGGGSDEV